MADLQWSRSWNIWKYLNLFTLNNQKSKYGKISAEDGFFRNSKVRLFTMSSLMDDFIFFQTSLIIELNNMIRCFVENKFESGI